MIICALLAFQAKSAPIDCDDMSKPVEDVLRVRNKDQRENFKTTLRHVMQQNRVIRDAVKGLSDFAIVVVESNPENEVLIDNMGLTLDEEFIQNMGLTLSEVGVEQYCLSRKTTYPSLCEFSDTCVKWLRGGRVVNPLRIVDEALNGENQEACSHPAQGPDPNDLMSPCVKFRDTITDAQRLVEEQASSIASFLQSIDCMEQDQVSRRTSRSDLSRFCDKSAMKISLKAYCNWVRSIKQDFLRILRKFSEFSQYLEEERHFRRKDNPLVVLQAKCAAFTLHKRCAYLRGNLGDFWELECRITAQIERLAGLANFFKPHNIEDESPFPELRSQNAEWYKVCGGRLCKFASDFIDEVGVWNRRRAHYTHCLYRSKWYQTVVSGSATECIDAQSLLKEGSGCDAQDLCSDQFDSNDWCINLEVLIKTLKEIKGWEEAQFGQRRVLEKNFYGVFCDQTAERALKVQLPYIKNLHRCLREYLSLINGRGKKIDQYLRSFSNLLNARN
ncbi:MAG: hypothetical protein OXC30_01245 [Alphaproteobacteria bacterium]|nr:hypothetical protein [Alphaproteobacteria bacterium]